MKATIRSFFFPLLLSAAGLAHAAPPPALVQISYATSKDGAPVARVVQRLEHRDGKYILTEKWTGKGLYALLGEINRTSRGIVTSRGLRPLEYSDARTFRHTAWARFDWSAHTLTQQYDGPAQTIALPPDAQDSLAFMYDFAFDPPAGKRVVLHIADGRHFSSQVYQVEGREALKIPAGEFDALKLVRRKGSGERAELFLAVDMGYLPVRLTVYGTHGERLDTVATRIFEP